jgi:hypothetical protein
MKSPIKLTKSLQMSNYIIFENEKKSLLTKLSLKYAEFSLESISSIAEEIDSYLKDFTLESLKRNSKAFFSLNISSDNVFFVDESSNFYELNFSDDLNNHDLLLIILSVRGSKREYAIENFDFTISECYGQYLSFNLTFPKKVKIKRQDTKVLITTIFETGYTWFFDKTINLAKQEEDKLGYRLYEFAKTVIHSKPLLNNLWFASITKGFGFRLLSESVVKESFKLIQPNSKKFKKSTNTLVAELLNTKLPEKQLLMINAITVKTSVDANLKNASYNNTDSLYAATLKSLYGQNQFTVHPIFESDKFCIVALFDPKNKTELVPILTRHKEALDEICKKSIEGVHVLLTKLKIGNKGFLSMLWEASEIKPNAFGLGLDIKKIIEYFKGGNKKNNH